MVYGPTIAPSNDIEEVEEENHDCIRVAHPGFPKASLPEFIDSVDLQPPPHFDFKPRSPICFFIACLTLVPFTHINVRGRSCICSAKASSIHDRGCLVPLYCVLLPCENPWCCRFFIFLFFVILDYVCLLYLKTQQRYRAPNSCSSSFPLTFRTPR